MELRYWITAFQKQLRIVLIHFLEQMRDLDDSMANLEFRGTVIDDSVIAGVQEKVDTIVATITNGLDSSKNDVLSTLDHLRVFLDQKSTTKFL